ncbi:AAA family ATPase [bacterium]|nr:AAA family ATPase [bacterium]
MEAAAPLAPPPFVGRASELARLEGALAAAAAGQGALYLIGGEPGIGKTRLADELTRRAAADGWATAWGRCWESGGAPAYWPWVQALRALVAELPADLVTSRVAAAPDLLHVLPELRGRLPDPPALEPPDAELGRFRVLDATTSLLRAGAAARPLLLVLDDLHAADHSSLLLLRFLARELRDLRLVVVGTYRQSETAGDPEVAAAFADLVRDGHRVTLHGLSADAVADYLAATAPARATPATIGAVHAASDGNPLFVSEMVRLWSTPGGAGDGALAIPEELRGTLRRRLAPLPEAVRRVLTLAAVQGREFDLVLVEHVIGTGGGAADAPVGTSPVSAALDLAQAAGIVRPLADTLGRFTFAHALMRDVLHDDLPSAERATLHRRVAAAMERMHAANLDAHLEPIAHHYAQAALGGEVDKAVEFARRAGDRALGLLAHEDAVQHFQHALRALELRRDGARPGDAVLRCELLLSLGDACWGTGDLGRMRATYERAADAARGLARAEGAHRLARAALGLGGRQQRAHVAFDQVVVGLLEESAAALGEEDSPLRARVLARLAYALYTRPDSAALRRRLCAEAEAMARRIGDPGTLRWVLNDARWALWGPDAIEQRLEMGRELSRIAERLGNVELVLDEHAWRVVDLLELGDRAAVDAELSTYAGVAREHRRPWSLWYVARFEAMRALLEGDFAAAEGHAGTALEAINRAALADAQLIYGTQLLAIRTEQGRLAELEAGMQAFVAQYPAVEIWRYVDAYLQAELERPEAARAALVRVLDPRQPALPEGYLRLAACSYLAEACAAVGDQARAAALYDLLLPYAGRAVVVGFGVICRGAVDRYLGLLAATVGRGDAAAAHFEAALAIDARLRAAPCEARTRYAYAQMLLARPGDAAAHAKGTALLAAAGAIAARLGMDDLRARIERLAAAHQPAPRAAPRAAAATTGALPCVFRREGEHWVIGLGDRPARLRDLRGFTYIAHLLGRPGDEVHVFDLVDAAEGAAADPATPAARDAGDAGPVLDAAARAAYRARLLELREALDEAELDHDLGRIERYRSEMEALASQLAEATGLGGRERRVSAPANRARVAVAKAVRIALARIDTHCGDFASHLRLTIRTGTFCCYVPDPLRPTAWDLGHDG